MSEPRFEFLSSFTAEGGARVQLIERLPRRGLWGGTRKRLVPTAEWLQPNPGKAAVLLLDLAGRGLAEDAGDAILLPANEVAGLDATIAAAVGLPAPAPIVLSLNGRGLVVDDSFGIDWRWVRANGTPVVATVTGARVRMDGREFRLPEPLFSLQRMAQRVNEQPDLPSKQAAFAELRRLLEGHVELAITDGILDEMRIAYAGHFSLALRTSGRGIDFDPVLFAPRVGEAAAEGTSVDEEADNLLTPAQQEAFARLFRKRAGRAHSYLLPDGLLLFMDPQLGKALRVVGEKQSAPPEERRRFAVAPRRSLVEALGSDADCFEALFVETAQYSERVTGIDPWRKPVLPWIKPKPNSWLPERLGVAIGDPPNQTLVEFPADDPEDAARAIEAAIENVEEAFQAGKADIELQGGRLPATAGVLEALRNLAGVSRAAKEAVSNRAAASTPPPPPAAEKMFLRVRENFEIVEYAPLAQPVAPEGPPPAVPAEVLTKLKPHQIEGFAWLVRAWQSQRPGVLLADDMGLGKTLQALAFFAWLRRTEAVSQPILVVAPTGLLANWLNEIDEHLVPQSLGEIIRADGAGLAPIRGGPGTDIEAGGPRLDIETWRKAGVVLTTYETLRDYHMSFARLAFAVVVFDEAQRIKNPAAQVTRAAKTLRARLSVAMTGTPVENRLHDLWSISDVVHPGLLGTSKAFEERFGAASLDRLRDLNARLTIPEASWPPFMLRRMKGDHLKGLPKKSSVERVKLMPPRQAQAYADAVSRALLLRSTIGRDGILRTLALLRSISLAPRLPEIGDSFEADSARLQAMFEILQDIQGKGEKVLVFCESLDLQPLLAAEIRRRYRLAHPVSCISGQTSGDVRQKLVDRFQGGPTGFDAMILSPRAGGVGLTLTAANHVIHLTRWWNPAVEDQATDRVYRIGQDKEVTIRLPIAEHPVFRETSFDWKLDALMKRKRELAAGLLVEPEAPQDAEDLLDEVLASTSSLQQAPRSSNELAPTHATAAEQLPPVVAASGNLRHQKRVGEPFPWWIFTDVLSGKTVRKLEITDPYAAGSARACQSLGQFLAGIRRQGATVEAVELVCFDNGSLPEARFESDAAQRIALRDAMRRNGVDTVRLFTRFVSRQVHKLHDRMIRAVLSDGTVILWHLGGGIDYLMDPRRECVIGRWINLDLGV